MSIGIKRIIPLLDRILVKRAMSPNQTKKGIMLPETAIPKKLEGVVIAVGPGARNLENGDHIPPVVQAGDRVLLPSYGGTKIDTGDDKQEFLIFRESDILAKMDEENN